MLHKKEIVLISYYYIENNHMHVYFNNYSWKRYFSYVSILYIFSNKSGNITYLRNLFDYLSKGICYNIELLERLLVPNRKHAYKGRIRFFIREETRENSVIEFYMHAYEFVQSSDLNDAPVSHEWRGRWIVAGIFACELYQIVGRQLASVSLVLNGAPSG